jgi:hypothetical protein
LRAHSLTERLANPDALLSRTDLRELGSSGAPSTRCFALPVIVLPGYSRPRPCVRVPRAAGVVDLRGRQGALEAQSARRAQVAARDAVNHVGARPRNGAWSRLYATDEVEDQNNQEDDDEDPPVVPPLHDMKVTVGHARRFPPGAQGKRHECATRG